jgi:hypothetical protein
MRCVFCGTEEMDPIILVPIWQPDGSLTAFACLGCTKNEGLYCDKHERPHVGFEDETTACLLCIEEFVKREEHRAHQVAMEIRNSLDHDCKEELEEAAEVASALTNWDDDVAILRFVASRAQRSGVSINDVVKEVVLRRSTEPILGNFGKWFS